MKNLEVEKNSVFVIDGTNLIHRNYYVFQNVKNKNGIHTGGLYGTVRSLRSYVDNFKPKQMIICFDKGKETFRHQLYPDYKGTRKKTDRELKNQFALFEEFCRLVNLPFIEMDLYEADDLIGSLCCNSKEYGLKSYAVTGDKDIFQLIDNEIEVLYLSHKGPVIYGEEEFVSEYGIQPSQFTDYKALVGDIYENIQGVPGVGKKTAEKLLKSYGSLDEIYNNVDKLKGKQKERILENKNNAYLSRKLSIIKCDIDLDYDRYFIDYVNEGYNLENSKVTTFLNSLGF